MSFHNVQFPTKISWGSASRYGFNTKVVRLDSGREERVSTWETARHSYDISMGIQSYEDLFAVKTFFLARGGAANGFRFKDFQDYHSHPTDGGFNRTPGTEDQQIGIGDGSNKAFQLTKTYTNGSTSYIRKILNPIASTVRVWVNAVEVFGFTVDDATGIVTLASAPSISHTVKASFEFDVPVAFSDDSDKAIETSITSFGHGDINSIILEEILDDTGVASEYPHRGSSEKSISANYALNFSDGSLHVFSATTTGLSVSLPTPTSIPTGTSLLHIVNSGSNSIAIKDHLGSTLVTLTSNQGCEIDLSLDSGGTKVWYAL